MGRPLTSGLSQQKDWWIRRGKNSKGNLMKQTIGIIGTGQVGMAAAYAVFLRGQASEIILIDKDTRRAEGEAMDLSHAQAFAESVTVRTGGYQALSGAQVVIIAAGVAQKPGESRLDLLNRNTEVFREIISQLDQFAAESVLIIASNPVDILTYISQKLSNRPASKIIGTGTMLDTARFRTLLGKYYGVDPRSVHAYILGEHGDSEVPLWSSARVGGVSLNHEILGKKFVESEMYQLFENVRNSAGDIISRKGYTNTAIGAAISRLLETIQEDQRSVLPVSCQINGHYNIEGVCLSVPAVIGLHGVRNILWPTLSENELTAMQHSAKILKSHLKDIVV
jgi:L-lactate dehydrogenase